MRLFSTFFALTLCGAAGPASSLPPTAPDRGFVEGANHHLGDRGFIAFFGRTPAEGRDAEDVRMWTHLAYVHGWLSHRPATHPDFAARRQELLGYLAEYVTLGVTPVNTVLPWRNPVFIDEHGQICAVGYLIERSSGRALPELIADREAYRYLEDIDLPGVAEWIATSGFTKEELASIQPGYQGPMIHLWKQDIREFPNNEEMFEGVVGNLRGGKMDGLWTVERDGATGRGEFRRGNGEWTGMVDGKLAAHGKYRDNQPDGIWQIFHSNGALAGEGRFSRGVRTGTWSFFHPNGQLLSRGKFDALGYVAGTWEMRAADGQTLGKTIVGPGYWSRFFGLPMPDATLIRSVDGIEHATLNASVQMVTVDGVRFYASAGFSWAPDVCAPDAEVVFFDDSGRLIVGDGEAWKYGDERVVRAYRAAAKRGDLTALYYGHRGCKSDCEMGYESKPFTAPTEPAVMPAARVHAFERARQIMCAPGGPSKDFEAIVPSDPTVLVDDDAHAAAPPTDWERLRAETRKDIQWSHIDGLFARAFRTMPNYIDQMM